MIKPILVVYLRIANFSIRRQSENIQEMQKIFEKSKIADEYYVLILPIHEGDSSVEVFYEKNFNKVSYTKLKSLLEEKISNI